MLRDAFMRWMAMQNRFHQHDEPAETEPAFQQESGTGTAVPTPDEVEPDAYTRMAELREQIRAEHPMAFDWFTPTDVVREHHEEVDTDVADELAEAMAELTEARRQAQLLASPAHLTTITGHTIGLTPRRPNAMYHYDTTGLYHRNPYGLDSIYDSVITRSEPRETHQRLWHEPSDIPQHTIHTPVTILYITEDGDSKRAVQETLPAEGGVNWEAFVSECHVLRWCYFDDLISEQPFIRRRA